jgi:hypothetical protein
MISYESWQIQNIKHIRIIFNIIVNNLKKNNIKILDEENLYLEIIRYLFKNKL